VPGSGIDPADPQMVGMKIAVASGKGGTGKTMVAANLAFTLSQGRETTLVDCDVEEPDLHLFFQAPETATEVTVPVPVFDEQACDRCGECGESCQYGAITVLRDRVLFFPELCHSCGGCTLACGKGAIHEGQRRIGQVTAARPSPRLTLITGILDEGKTLATPVIRAAKEMAAGADLVIYDSAPGTACPVIETLDGSDVAILVTESTPFGLHDLLLAADVVKVLGMPAGVVINRSDGHDEKTREFCENHGLPVLMTIPFDRGIAAIQNRGGLLCAALPVWQRAFSDLFRRCEELAGGAR
jgi:MinD superfamily P-loop ATPase